MKKKILVSVFLILGIILATIGLTYAFLSYSKTGATINKIKSGNITFNYKEDSRGVSIQNAMPMTDEQGKNQSNYFDFTITSKTSETLDIPYYITVNRSGDNLDGVVKLYLTKVDDNNNESEVVLKPFSTLGTYTHNSINIPVSEKLLYTDRVFAGDTNYEQKYRLRMWIDINASYIDQTGGVVTYPLQDKTYSIKVNVYSNGEIIDQTAEQFRQNVNLENIQIGNNVVTTKTTSLEETEIMPAGETTTTKTITVNTTNPNAIVTIENLTETASVIKENKVKRLSSNHTLNLILGTNTFKITVSSPNKKTSKIYNLVINTEYPSYKVGIIGSHVTGEDVLVKWNDSNIGSISIANGYYLNSVSCTNGYQVTVSTGNSIVGTQTITISNNTNIGDSLCTFNVTPITYTINYNLNDGIQESNPTTSYTIETNTFNLPIPTKSGYIFGGWYTSLAFNGSSVSQIAKGTTGNKVYYAKWNLPAAYSIKFNGNGSTSGSMSNQTIYIGTSTALTINSYRKNGYNFLGWSTSPTSTTVTYTDGQLVNDLTTTSGATVNLYAVWKISDFATDSWEIIKDNIMTGNISNYSIGATKSITLENGLGTHTLRIANKTACTTETSTTACGFVIEFADIISKQQMNATTTNTGGYPASFMYDYLSTTIYNSIPEKIRNIMINTTVISGHEKNVNNNYIQYNQKIYLLSNQEIFGNNSNLDSANDVTRQLDYYNNNNANASSRIKADVNGNKVIWATRTATSTSTYTWRGVGADGSMKIVEKQNLYGVSPAFRIG